MVGHKTMEYAVFERIEVRWAVYTGAPQFLKKYLPRFYIVIVALLQLNYPVHQKVKSGVSRLLAYEYELGTSPFPPCLKHPFVVKACLSVHERRNCVPAVDYNYWGLDVHQLVCNALKERLGFV